MSASYDVSAIPLLGGANQNNTALTGLNERGDVVGYTPPAARDQWDYLEPHAFLYTHGKGTTADLSAPDDSGFSYSTAAAVNNSGQVVGGMADVGRAETAFLYSDSDGNGTSEMTDLGVLGGHSGSRYSEATDINDGGQIVGFSTVDYRSGPLQVHAFLYSDGKMTDLGTLGSGINSGGITNDPVKINNAGQIAGSSDTDIDGIRPHAFLYSDGKMNDLGTLGGLQSYATDLNSSGQVAGRSFTGPEMGYQEHAFLYSGGKMTDLGTLGGSLSRAVDVNDAGQVVGYSTTADGASHAFLHSDGKMIDLGTLGGGSSTAMAINDKGQVIGQTRTAEGVSVAFVWSDANSNGRSDPGEMMDLNAVIPTNSGWQLRIALRINNAGQIVGGGTGGDGSSPYYILTPKPNAAPVANAGLDKTTTEGETVAFDAAASTDADGDVLSYTWNFGDGTTVTGTTPSHVFTDDGAYTVTLTVEDGKGGTHSDTLIVAVANAAPKVGAVSISSEPTPVGTAIHAGAEISDVGVADTHTATWDWGDGTATVGSVTAASGGGSAVGSHVYARAGVYTVMLTVTDDDGGSGQSVSTQQVVVYDPTAGYVTGGGWIDSPMGAYAADPTLSGRASFGFVSQYQKGATVPTGQTQFRFQAGDLNFHSGSYDWMVVSGAKAQYKGTGSVNGVGGYRFMLTAVDGQRSGGGGVDKFRIRIWSDVGGLVYDNQAVGDNEGTAIGGGSIVIHP